MKDGGRLSAAIEVLSEIELHRRPVQAALKDWGIAHRFAGSKDRAVVGNVVFDALRRKRSLAWRMQSDEPRALALSTYAVTWRQGTDKLIAALADDRHAPSALTSEEVTRLSEADLEGAPDAVLADVPDWLWPEFERSLPGEAITEGKCLSDRAPVDMRVNTLKATREKVLKRLGHLPVIPTAHSHNGIRIKAEPGIGRMPAVQVEEIYRKGWFELQDEASQLAALLSGAEAGNQVLDFCAGGGGKTLALAAQMENRGQIYAFDADRVRLAPIHDRLSRAGARCVQVRDPKTAGLEDLQATMDLVFVDAPCTGTGVWRRRPDSKWRLSERALSERLQEQVSVLDSAANYVRPGGHLTYATCSVLTAENSDQVDAFLARNPQFEIVSAFDRWIGKLNAPANAVRTDDKGNLTLTPRATGTDGFFVSLLRRAS